MSDVTAMPVAWQAPSVALRIALSPLDEFGMAFDRRGWKGDLPTDPKEFDEFADTVSAIVRETILVILRDNHARKENA